MVRLILRFQLSISDSPFASYDDNHQLLFERAEIEIFDRGIPRVCYNMGLPEFDEEKEDLRSIGSYPIFRSTGRCYTASPALRRETVMLRGRKFTWLLRLATSPA